MVETLLSYFSNYYNLVREILYSFPPEDVTLFFIGLIFFIFLIFLLILFFRTYCEWRRLKKVNVKVNNCITDGEIDVEKRQQFRDISAETKKFDSALFEYNKQLYSTQDVENISENLWYPKLLQSHLLPTVSSVLTGIGVLGTFIGLFIGLKELQLNGSVVELQEEIRTVARSASTAFETSVAGVALSLIFTFLKKSVSSFLYRGFREFQNKLIKLFPQFPVATLVKDLNDNSRSTADSLNGLAEQLGNKLQTSFKTSIDELTNVIALKLKEPITNELVPAVDRITQASSGLAEKQAHSSEEALKALLDEFMNKMGAAGIQQYQSMDKATKEMNESLNKFSEKITGLFSALDSQQKSLFDSISTQQSINEKSQQLQLEMLYDIVKNISTEYKQNVEDVTLQQKSSYEEINGLITNHVKSTEALIEQGKELQSRVENDGQLFKESTENLTQFSDTLRFTTGKLDDFSSKVSNSITTSGQSITKIVDLFDRFREEQEKITNRFKILSEALEQTSKNITSGVETSAHSYKHIADAFSLYQTNLDDFITKTGNDFSKKISEVNTFLVSYVEKIDSQVTSLLKDYFDEVAKHQFNLMTKWDENTSGFCDKIVEATQNLGEIINGLENVSGR